TYHVSVSRNVDTVRRVFELSHRRHHQCEPVHDGVLGRRHLHSAAGSASARFARRSPDVPAGLPELWHLRVVSGEPLRRRWNRRTPLFSGPARRPAETGGAITPACPSIRPTTARSGSPASITFRTALVAWRGTLELPPLGSRRAGKARLRRQPA